MFPLPGQFEFLSDAWIEEAKAWFARRREGLGAPFSISERFGEAPPHLELPGNEASWTIRWDGTDVAIARGFDAKADATCEGDYQAALMSAQWVGMLVPGATSAMLREVKAAFGKGAITFGGEVAPPVVELMGHFHDHMARRTVENPDLEHRARRLGLTGHIREMEEQG